MSRVFLTAFYKETECVKRACPRDSVYQIGQGKESVENFFRNKNIPSFNQIFFVGFCGALSVEKKIGDIVCPLQAVYLDDTVNISNGTCDKIYTSDVIVGHSEERKRLFLKTKASVVDMESFFVAKHFKNKNFKIVKAVMDDYTLDLPGTLEEIRADDLLMDKINENIKTASRNLEKYLVTV